MSELLDKQVSIQNESLKKYIWGSCKLLQAHKKVCDEEKNDVCIKILLMEDGAYWARMENSCHGYQ